MQPGTKSSLQKLGLFNILAESETKPKYGGSGEFSLPENHQAGMKVPKGGSSCSNCRFLDWEPGPEGAPICTNQHFIKWQGSNKIPGNDDEYCSDWWEGK